VRRILRMIAMSALALAVLGEAGTATAATAAGPHAAAADCTGTIQITQFAFSASTVTAGQDANGNLTAVNCTAQSLTTSVYWYGQYLLPPSSVIPPGCPVMDPFVINATFAPNGQYTQPFSRATFSQCTATLLQVTVSFHSSTGTVFAQATTQVNITGSAPPPNCRVTYTLNNEWRGGFTASIAITNTGTQPINGWTLTYVYGGDQRITNAWGAGFSQNGIVVTLSSLAYDSTIPPGTTLSSVGMYGTWTTSDGPPANFTLNGVRCV